MSELPLPCSRCGYDLRGVGDSERCPECGFEISLHRGEASAAHVKWRGAIRRGSDALVVALAASIATTLLACALLLFSELLLLVSAPLIAFAFTDALALGVALLAFASTPPGRRLSPLLPIAVLAFAALAFGPIGLCLLLAAPPLILIPFAARVAMPTLLVVGILRVDRILGGTVPRRLSVGLVLGSVGASLAGMLAGPILADAHRPTIAVIAAIVCLLVDTTAHGIAVAASRRFLHRLDQAED